MNRDWKHRGLPETDAVIAAIRKYQPDIFLDLHEQTPIDKAGCYIQLSGKKYRSSIHWGIRQRLKASAVSCPITLRGGSGVLAHANFAANHKGVGILVESQWKESPYQDFEGRAAIHLAAMEGSVLGMAKVYEKRTLMAKQASR